LGREYRTGPVVKRRSQVPTSTHDKRLLDNTGGADWVHTDPWRVLRIQSEFVEGFGALAELGPAVSGVRIGAHPPVGPDLRHRGARRRGARRGRVRGHHRRRTRRHGGRQQGRLEAGGTSVGLGHRAALRAGLNEYVDLGVNFRYFFAARRCSSSTAQGFIVLPGGFGTLDELFEALTLVQTDKVTRFPIVLLGSAYWAGLLGWLRTDDVDDAVGAIVAARDSLA
jgi:hypothetical protein